MDSFELLKADCQNCTKCDISKSRHNVVVGCGNEHSKVMFIGEGPGETEDLQGEPFVGKAGQFLDLMLELIEINRSQIYICNVIKCRPPLNRDPSIDERRNCRSFVDRQISLLQPQLIVLLGRVAACEIVDPQFKITQQRGQWFKLNDIDYIATYHPSALLRDESKRPDAFSDFQRIRAKIREQRLI